MNELCHYSQVGVTLRDWQKPINENTEIVNRWPSGGGCPEGNPTHPTDYNFTSSTEALESKSSSKSKMTLSKRSYKRTKRLYLIF